MKKGVCYAIFWATVLMLLFGCGGSGGSGGGSGTLSMNITDAKPVIPGDPVELWITFEDVLVHKPGGGWISLPLPETPLTINLLAFQDGDTTELVTPVEIDSGKYTQVRFVLSSAQIVTSAAAQEILDTMDLDVPSGTLRTDKNFTFQVDDGAAVDLTVDFDLSQSIVATGSSEFKLKPVLHLNETQVAATICGSINAGSFGVSEKAIITVIEDSNGETYTEVTVTRDSDTDPTEFCIFWLVPEQDYTIEIDTDEDGSAEFVVAVSADDLEPGEELNIGTF